VANGVGVALQLAVEVHDVQDVEQLALVLVDALDLDVEDRAEHDLEAVLPAEAAGRRSLRRLGLGELLEESRIVGKLAQALELVQVFRPGVAELLLSRPASQGLLASSQRRGVTPLSCC